MANIQCSSNHLAFLVYKTLLQQSNGTEKVENVFFSPASIFAALTMVYAGTRGETANQMKELMKLEHGSTDKDLHEAVHTMWQKLLDCSSEASFELGNRIWLQSGMDVVESFQDTLRSYYQADAQQADFTTSAEKVRLEINEWVESQTKEKIKDLIGEGILNELTRFVIVNAIYFKGKWKVPFKKDDTTDLPFRSKDNVQSIPFMVKGGGRFRYFEDNVLKCQVLELPYQGTDIVMVLALPSDVDGLCAMIDAIDMQCKEGKPLSDIVDNWVLGRPEKVDVYIPRFKFSQSCELSNTLSKLGMSDLFNNNADLSGVTGKRDLFVKYVIHKAFVEVNEEGTEAAAATAAIAMMRCMPIPRPTPVFKADHPFMFLIYDRNTKAVIFMGHAADSGNF